MADNGAALHRATSMIVSTSIEMNLSFATISLCSGAMSVSSLRSGGGIKMDAGGIAFSFPIELDELRRWRLVTESMKVIKSYQNECNDITKFLRFKLLIS